MTKPERGRTRVSRLPEDGMAFALREASRLVAEVRAGANLTDAFNRMQRAAPQWQDGTRGAIRDLAWGCLRDYGRGDRVLSILLSKPLPDEVHALLLVAIHRLENRPDQAYVIVDQAVEAVASYAPGLRGVVNGVLRNTLRSRAQLSVRLTEDWVARYRYPSWWIRRVRATRSDVSVLREGQPAEQGGVAAHDPTHPGTVSPAANAAQQWEQTLEQGNQRPPMCVRANVRRIGTANAAEHLRQAGIACRVLENGAILLERPVQVRDLPGFAEGWFSVQDAGAQWAAQWLDLAPGQRVLDACAAPGGKSCHILEVADVELLALELDPQRSRRITENLDRLGLSAQVSNADARRVEDWWDGVAFDRILADVPCSASGVVRRHPDIKWLRREKDIEGFARQQAEILDALWRTLAEGGKMLYVTCSIFDEENGLQIRSFCERHADAERVPLNGRIEHQFLPDPKHDGFYYALLRKRG